MTCQSYLRAFNSAQKRLAQLKSNLVQNCHKMGGKNVHIDRARKKCLTIDGEQAENSVEVVFSIRELSQSLDQSGIVRWVDSNVVTYNE
jgi:hypothetical protein